MKNCVYVLKLKNGRYYIGSCKDLQHRLNEHQKGRVKSTRYLLPVSLVFFQSFDIPKKARQIEYWLKKSANREMIDKIIREGTLKKQP